jgi:hypothetical protein
MRSAIDADHEPAPDEELNCQIIPGVRRTSQTRRAKTALVYRCVGVSPINLAVAQAMSLKV